MSSIYNLEPQPTASVILHTTQGDLSVELFAKQTPLTSRNFLQLCLDGYYDNTIFHRLVPGFILQGGDPTGSGNGGECIYDGGALNGDLDPWPEDQRHGKNAGPTGVNFKDEFHSRLKFNRRGLLGMANEGKPDTNGSQFFFTLDKAEELNNKNTVFGRIAGDTIYNLARMGEAEVAEGTDRPLYPIRITTVEILTNPFEDITKRTRVAPQSQAVPVVTQKKKKKPNSGKKLLSFGDDEGDGEPALIVKKAKFDTRIVMDIDEETIAETNPRKKRPREEKELKKSIPVREHPVEESEESKSAAAPSPPVEKVSAEVEQEDYSSPEPEFPKKSALEKANDEIAALKASMKRTVDSAPVREVRKTGIEQFIPETSTRGRKRRKAGETSMSSAEYTSFQAFKARLQQAPPEPEKEKPRIEIGEDGAEAPTTEAQDDETELCDLHFIANCQSCKTWDKVEGEEDDSDDDGWMAHKLSFAADKLGKDLSYRKKAEDELMVIDPREKARTLKEEKKAKQEARAGGSGREWDQARNQKLAKQSALAGRGAR
ncbi:cyclophilin-like domain-containing protein [Pseudomassariella vexata]|uniref:peptidylprolyl isomerase n=1 Tax=Pseudomassariella vexata TaxID=1141098 RepID=A0A1Y2DCF0_9PEZI|nr:cyclophilin-like domain-containing protein [Pseudomassariella vexata]ORY56941.1 cyclophilin-like domain-containing protein [Pseudomassariella vexata]